MTDSDDDELQMPKTRAGCCDIPRPCPFARCKYNLAIDLGGKKLNQITVRKNNVASCALDVAEMGGLDQKEVADLLGDTYQWVQQLEYRAMRKVAAAFLEERFTSEMLASPCARPDLMYKEDLQWAEWLANGASSKTQSK